MPYRRSHTPGATYFFTVVTYRLRPILCEPKAITLRREAFKTVKQHRPFQIDAIGPCLLLMSLVGYALRTFFGAERWRVQRRITCPRHGDWIEEST